MPRIAKELSALDVRRLEHSGSRNNSTFAVGGVSGLLLQITPNGGKSWVLRVKVGDKRRELGLGSYPDVSLSMARERARAEKEKVWQGIDPIEDRKARKAHLIAAQRRGLTFSDAVERYLDTKLDQFKNPKHQQQWRNTLNSYAIPELGEHLVQDVTVQDVLRVLQPIWFEKTETAKRLRGRIEAVLSWATVSGHRSGDNPARWNGNLKELLPAPNRIAREQNQPALQIVDLQRWIYSVREIKGIVRYALEFTLLTVARSQEIRGAQWEEFDLERGVWIIPAKRMKKEREHRIPLSTGALDVLSSVPRLDGNNLVFSAPKGGILSDMALSAAMKRLHNSDLKDTGIGFLDRVSKRPAVPHGLRSTFRDWVAEHTRFDGDMAEIALAHKVSNAVEAAYRRGDMIEKRRAMMQAWSDYVNGKNSFNNVIGFEATT